MMSTAAPISASAWVRKCCTWVPMSLKYCAISTASLTASKRCAATSGLLATFSMAEARSRSEEHTSELQSLMRISYAVFCLNKKKQKNTHQVRPSRAEQSSLNISYSYHQLTIYSIHIPAQLI